MTTRQTKADKEAAAAAAAEHDASVEQIAPPDEKGADMVTAPPPGQDNTPTVAEPTEEALELAEQLGADTTRFPDAEHPADAGNIASPGPDAIPVHRDGELVPDQAVSSQPIDLEGQRRMLDNLASDLAGLDAADVGRAIDEARAQAGLTTELEPAVYLIHPDKGHVVHVPVTQAIAEGMLGWPDATLDDIRRAGLTA